MSDSEAEGRRLAQVAVFDFAVEKLRAMDTTFTLTMLDPENPAAGQTVGNFTDMELAFMWLMLFKKVLESKEAGMERRVFMMTAISGVSTLMEAFVHMEHGEEQARKFQRAMIKALDDIVQEWT